MFEVIKNFRNIPRNQVLKLKLISHLKHKKIMSEAEIKSLPREIFTKDLVEKYGEYLECRLDIPEVFEYFLKNNRIVYIPDNLNSNKQILIKCIENKRYDLIDDFLSNAFTEEVILKLTKNEEYIKKITTVSYQLRGKSLFLQKCIDYERYDLIDAFYSSAFTEEIIVKLTKTEGYVKNIITIPDVLKNNSLFLQSCIENQRYDLIDKFKEGAFTKEIIASLVKNKEYIKNITIIPDVLQDKSLFLQSCIENQRYDLINHFSFKIITDSFKKDLINNEEFIKNTKIIPIVLKDNSDLLQKCIEYKRYDLMSEFNYYLFENISKEFGQNEEFIKKTTLIPYELQKNIDLLKKCIEYKRYELIYQFSEELFTPDIIELIENNKKLLQNIIENNFYLNLESMPFLKNSFQLLQKCIEYKKYYLIESFNQEAFTKDIIEKLVINEEYIKKTKNIPDVLQDSSLFLQKCIEYKRYDLINHFNQKLFTPDIIKLIENNEEFLKNIVTNKYYLNFYLNLELSPFFKNIILKRLINLLSQNLNISYEEIEYKINYLFTKNNEIFSTLNLNLLSKEYNVLDIDFIEKIGNYESIQVKILKLNGIQLLTFSKISKLLINSDYDLSYMIETVLNNLVLYGNAQYDDLIKSVNENELSNEQLKNLIYILKKKNNIYEISSIDQLTESNFKGIKQQYRKKIESSVISGLITNEQLKEAIFEEKFGLNMTEVKFIIQRYCHNIDELEKSNINKEIRLILKSLKDIDDCDDFNELTDYYNNTEFLLTDFYAPIFLESVIRNEYIKEYDKTLYKLDKKHSLIEILHDNPKLNELEHIRNLINLDVSGKKTDFYILDDDFNMLIHALNAYSQVSKHANFKEEWEVPLISNHGVCTSYIGNNQIATARIKSVVLGFSSLEGGSIYRASDHDISSDNRELSISSTAPDKFLLPNKMIDNTRHTHNEIVIERRGTKSFKRMPDYLVLFVDDINNSANFDPLTNEHYKYTLQASIDFNIPIVIVDRLKYAKREYEKCEKLLIEFSNSFDNEKLDELLLIFFNNAIGCKCYDAVEYEYNKIFNQNAFDNLYNRIINIIEQQDDLKKLDLFSKLLSYLEIEKEKQGDEITISLEEKINLLKDNIEELKKYKMDKFIKINNLEDFERILLSMSVQSSDDDFMILYGNNTFKVDLSKASFKKVPELAEASFLNRMKLLETLSGKYIPICDLNDNVLFTEEEYNKMREKMSGLKQYNTGDFIFSDNLYFPQLDDYLDIIDDNLKTNDFINDAINNNVTSSLANINLIIGKDFELINTGSTARGTNLPNDIDFDYVMKIELEKIDIIKQNLLNNLSCEEKTIIENRIRLKQVKIEGLNQLVDIDITFVAKEKYYSSDAALAERLEQIKKQDYEKYKLILANIMYAKKILKEANVYKASRSDKIQAGLGGIGIENWILQNGGSLLNAAKEFLKYSKDTNFIDFEKKYFINDYGKNHVSMTRHQFPYDNYVMKNMREQGYIKMQKCLEQFMQSIENDISKKR